MITYNRKDSEKEYRHIYSETLFASETITTLKINYTSSKKKKPCIFLYASKGNPAVLQNFLIVKYTRQEAINMLVSKMNSFLVAFTSTYDFHKEHMIS